MLRQRYYSLESCVNPFTDLVVLQAEESSLFAKLTLEDAYARFRADMLLGSLAESSASSYDLSCSAANSFFQLSLFPSA